MTNLLLVGLGGFFGAVARYVLSNQISVRFTAFTGTNLPWGTAFVNVTGSLLLAIFLSWLSRQIETPVQLKLLLGTGFFGAYTTFSTYANESIDLLREDWRMGVSYIVLTNLLCLIGVMMGVWLSEMFWRQT
ncbi:MAG: fluoride efflux transporter CrcB [Aggregatilineales bacterium]